MERRQRQDPTDSTGRRRHRLPQPDRRHRRPLRGDAAEYVNVEATEGTITVQGTLEAHPNNYGGEYCCYGEVSVTFRDVLFGAADGSHIDAAVLDAIPTQRRGYSVAGTASRIELARA